MSPKDVARSYDLIAERWDSDSFPRHNGIDQHKRALAFLNRRGSALDLGCGSSGRILDLMLENGYAVAGLDISERMIELARRRDPQVTFHHADICQWEFPIEYDFISAWDSIWHIPLDEHERVLGKILKALTRGGVCIFTTGGVDTPSETRDSAMGVPMYHSAPGISRIMENLARSGCVCRHLEYDQFPELHVCIIAQKLSTPD